MIMTGQIRRIPRKASPSTTLSITNSTLNGRRQTLDLVEIRGRYLPTWTVARFHLPLNVGIHHIIQHRITAWKTKIWILFRQCNQTFRCLSLIVLTFSIFTYLSSRPTSALKNKRFWHLRTSEMFLSLMYVFITFRFLYFRTQNVRCNIKKFKVFN